MMKSSIIATLTLTILVQIAFAQEVEKKVLYKTEIAIPYYSEEISKDDAYMQEMCVFDF